MSTKFMRQRLWLISKLPRWLIYMATVRLVSHALACDDSELNLEKLSVLEALDRWDK